MRLEKRRWIFEGLAVPPGVAAVSPVSSRALTPPKSILLASDDERHLLGLGAPMRRMLERGWLVTAAKVPATLCLTSVDDLFTSHQLNVALWLVSTTVPADVQRGADELAARRGIKNLWVSREVAAFDHMTASDYAAWAARLWRNIARGNHG